MNASLRICGIDPGTHCAGYGIVDCQNGELTFVATGALRAKSKSQNISLRLHEIYKALDRSVEHFKPDILVIEKAFYGKSIEAAIRLGEGRGIVLLYAAQRGIPIAEYPPAVVKKAVVGFGRADKSQVGSMVQAMLGLKSIPEPADATDALALAICHGHRVALTPI